MPAIGAAAFRKFGFVQSSIVTRWAEIVGPHYATISEPESIRFPAGKKAGGTLQLTVMSGHAPMIQHVLPDIMERVNRFFGYAAVAKIAMKQGMVQPREPERRPRRPISSPFRSSWGFPARHWRPRIARRAGIPGAGLANSSGLPKIS